MILINLLPKEFQQKRRTPLKMMVALAASVAINTSLLAFWAWTAFGVAAEVSSELAVLEDTMAGLNPQIAYHESLEKESKLFQSREKTLGDVTKNRVPWTRKLDELIDVINKGGDGEKYLVWLDGVNVDCEINERKGTYGTFSATGNSGSNRFSDVANFLDDVQESTFQADFNAPESVEGSQASYDEELVPAEVWSFPFELTLLPPEERGSIDDEEPEADAETTAKSAKAPKSEEA